MNKRTIYTIIIAVILFAIFFNPFRRQSENDVRMPYVRSETVESLEAYLQEHHQSPEDLIVDLFSDHSIVFLGEFGQIRQQLEVLLQVIPQLYERGIRNLGLEIALSEDNDRIAEIVTADEYDEAAVHEVLFDRMVLWGYQEYADIFRTVWEVNRNRPDGREPFRIVGLSLPISWENLETERQMDDPEIIASVYERGVPDVHMADTIITEFVQKGERALVFTSMQHAFTSFIAIEYAEKARDLGLSDDRRAGNIVYDRIGTEAATVLFHQPWPYQRAQTLITYPVDGALDRLMEGLPTELLFAGFRTLGTPFGELESDLNDFSKGYEEDLLLKDFCDAYIITGPIPSYETVTPIPGFIDESNIDEAIANFPGPNIDPVTVEEMNSYIANILESRKQIVDRF